LVPDGGYHRQAPESTPTRPDEDDWSHSSPSAPIDLGAEPVGGYLTLPTRTS
jgi:hypothetical protein